MERKIVTLDNLEHFYGKIQNEKAEKLDKIIEISYFDLVDLRNNNKLIPGQQYRITDYTCTTIQDGTKSAGHVFDIIVRADSVNKLNEESHAIQHTGDSYFADNDLSAWKIWYCLDNDTKRFNWADITNGKGVIYRMIDEFYNDVPYDFKNIQFYRKWNSNKSLWSTISSDTTGVPCYTFSSSGDSSTVEFTDMSLRISNIVHSNVIKEYIDMVTFNFDNIKLILNNNCFFGKYYHSNTFGSSCEFNTFGDSCEFNTFGDGCSSNTFGDGCNSNTFGSSCEFNTFGDSCEFNTFGNGCNSNTFGNGCNSNTFGNGCYNNTFGNSFRSNTFGNDCYYNTFGNDCQSNTFGNDCKYIKFASDSSASTKYSYYRDNHFGDGCSYILFKGAETGSGSVQVQNYNFAQGLRGTSSAYLTIDGKRNRTFETKVAKNSKGELKVYCEADLIL